MRDGACCNPCSCILFATAIGLLRSYAVSISLFKTHATIMYICKCTISPKLASHVAKLCLTRGETQLCGVEPMYMAKFQSKIQNF